MACITARSANGFRQRRLAAVRHEARHARANKDFSSKGFRARSCRMQCGSDADYFRKRESEERARAAGAQDRSVVHAHMALAREYRLRSVALENLERRREEAGVDRRNGFDRAVPEPR